MESASGKVALTRTPSNSPGKASATCRLVYAPPDPPVLTVYAGTPNVSMKCSFPIIVVSPARKGLQLLVGWLSVFANSAYPSPSRVRLSAVSRLTPSAAPWRYQPPGQPLPCCAIRRLFQPLGGENGVGGASEVGSCKTTFWSMPRFMVPVSTRTTNGTVTPAVVVVSATSLGR